jgi:hypothetical protein
MNLDEELCDLVTLGISISLETVQRTEWVSELSRVQIKRLSANAVLVIDTGHVLEDSYVKACICSTVRRICDPTIAPLCLCTLYKSYV